MKSRRKNMVRRGVAAAEFAVCLPILALLLLGVWEVGRMTEVQNVVWNSMREAGRDASQGQADMQTVASNLLVYLQAAEPTAFAKGHSTTFKAPVVKLPANTYGLMCWDNTANQELFTMAFTDITDPTVTDPTGMSQLDVFQVQIQVPYTTIAWLPVPTVTGKSRLYSNVTWVSMVDSPFQIAPSLPAQ